MPAVTALLAGAPIGVDMEATGLNLRKDTPITVQFGTPAQVFVLDVRGMTDAERKQHGEVLQRLIDSVPYIIGHNLIYDLSWLHSVFGVNARRAHDTLLQEKVLVGRMMDSNGHIGFDMKAVAARYGLNVEKDTREAFLTLGAAPLTPALLDYCAQDVLTPCLMDGQQWRALCANGLAETAALENMTLPAIVRLNTTGFAIDVSGWKTYLEKQEARLAEQERAIQTILLPALQQARAEACEADTTRLAAWENALADYLDAKHAGWEEIPAPKPPWGKVKQDAARQWKRDNPRPEKPAPLPERVLLSSTKQLQEALSLLGVHIASTASDVLEEYTDVPVVAALLKWKEAHKLITSFGHSLLDKVAGDGRLYAEYGQLGTDTGRLVCKSPNIQQIPSHETGEDTIRSHFVAEPGNVLLITDYSQIETRILADLSEDTALLDMFTRDEDVYSGTARLMFGLDSVVNPKKEEYRLGVSYRDVAKTITLGLAYGLSPAGLAARIGIPQTEAERLVAAYFQHFPGIKRCLDRLSADALRTGESRTYAGRRRCYDPPRDDSERGAIRRQARNAPIQGTSADIMKLALAMIHSALPETARLVGSVHDEVIIEAREEDADAMAVVLSRGMHQAAHTYLKRVALPAMDVTRGKTWAAKE